MRKKFFRSTVIMLSLLLGLSMVFTTSCKKEDDGGGDPPVLVEDGFYVKGAATALTDLTSKGQLKTAKNEVVQEDRSMLKELYVAIKAGADGFNIVEVAGATQTTWGPGADFAEVQEADLDTEEPSQGLWRGSLSSESASAFTVPEDGLYHITLDTELEVITIARVKWGVIGAATPGGWSGSTALTEGAFDLNSITFSATDVVMIVGDYKFRYSDGWKIILDADYDLGGGNTGIKVNTNFGGSLTALEAGGDNMSNAENGVFTVTVTWSLEDGTSASLEKTGEYTPPAYPDAVYLVGDASAYGWDTPGTKDTALFHAADGGSPTEGVFWKIAHLEADLGFKISEADWGTINLGYNEVDEFDAGGVTVGEVDGNMKVSTSGMYMIVLDLRDNMKKVSVIAPEVYGIGDAFGGWDAGVAGNLFTVDNATKSLVSPALSADGNIRTYVAHSWIPDWWNAEFVPNAGEIEYRNNSGADPSAIAGTTGQVITYYFDTNTSKVE